MSKTEKKILVVDDSPIAQEIAAKWLKQAEYIVIQAWDNKDCLQKIKEENPDVILMDVIMPDGDGKELVQRIQADPKNANIPIIFTTNTLNLETDKGYEVFELDGKIYRAFAKPLHFPKLLSVIRKEMNRIRVGGKFPSKIHKAEDKRNKEPS